MKVGVGMRELRRARRCCNLKREVGKELRMVSGLGVKDGARDELRQW